MQRAPGFLGAMLLIAVLVLLPMAAFAGEVQTLPLAPTLLPDMHNFELSSGNYEFTNPYIPPLTTTLDHRIGLVRKRAGSGGSKAVFHLLKPEELGTEAMKAGSGATILSSVAVEVDASLFDHATGGSRTTHFAICDPKEGTTKNPYVCNTDHECYDFKVITGVQFLQSGNRMVLQLWSAEVSVEVEHPKTAKAKIFNVSVTQPGTGDGGPILAGTNHGYRDFHTPMIVGDNRLLVASFGNASDFNWLDASNTTRPATNIDVAYAYYSGGDECDIDGWTNFKPFVYAPEDPAVNSQFGFADYPIRTPSGTVFNSDPAVAALEDIKAGYIWMDQDAKNLFFASLGRRLIDATEACVNPPPPALPVCHQLYDLACVSGTSCSDPYDPASEPHAYLHPEEALPHMGWMMLGRWTHGKMVLLDSLVNHADFALEGEENHHRIVSLYSDADVRVGAGRDAGDIGNNSTSPYGWIDTTVQFGSNENYFNMLPNLRPRTPQDVAWIITAGGRSDEIGFDDYISFRTLIFSPMNALKEMVSPFTYYDGNDLSDDTMRLQNAATSLRWNTPAYGAVVLPSTDGNQKGRIENVALGGIKARGFHLHPETRIDYVIPSQPGGAPDPAGQEWLIGLFLDRTVESWGEIRRLVTLPSGAHIDLFGLSKIKVCPAGSSICPAVTLPKPIYTRGFTHLAFHLDPGDEKMRFYQDGFLFAELDLPYGMEIEAGTLKVGSPDGGTTLGAGGWIDEFRVVEGPFSYENVCNYAHGSLVSVPKSYATLSSNDLADLLAPFNAASSNTYAVSGREAVHEALYGAAAQVDADSDYYVCNIDYSDPLGISVHDPGDANARPLHRRLTFPEGPIVWNQYRPNSLANSFCTSCHRDEEKGGLTTDALELDTTDVAEDDLRRQPSQAPAMLLGHIPASYLATGKPAASSEVGAAIDAFVHDGPLYRYTFDEGAGSSVANWVIGDPEASSTGGTLHGAAFEPGETRGHALEFDAGQDGTSDDVDYLEIAHPIDIDGDALTLAAFFRLGVDGVAPSDPGDQCTNFVNGKVPCTLIAKSADGSNHDFDWGLRIFYRATDTTPTWRAQLLVKTGTTLHSLDATLTGFDPAIWHHLAGTFDGGLMKIYLDGTSVASNTVSATTLATSSSHKVTIGSRLSTGGAPLHPFFGLIDEVRIYNRALLDWEVDALATATP